MLIRYTHNLWLAIILCTTNVAVAQSPADRINACRNTATTQITEQVAPYTSPVVQVRAGAGSWCGLSCCRQEEYGSVVFYPKRGYVFERLEFKTGNWENASPEGISWSPQQTMGQIKVHGHGCDRDDPAIGEGYWTGQLRRYVLPEESDAIWQTCIQKELKQ